MGATAVCAAAVRPAVPAFAAENEAALYAQAKREGAVTWWTAQVSQSTAEKLRAAFMERYPGIDVRLTRQPAQPLYQRLRAEMAAGFHEADLFATTDVSQCVELKRQNALAPFVPSGTTYLPRPFQTLDPDGTFFLGSLFFVLIDFNPEKLVPAPTKWTALIDPKMMNLVTIGHPAFSGAAAAWVVAMNDNFGWDYMNAVAANKPKIERSIFGTVDDVISGRQWIGTGPGSRTFEEHAKHAQIDGVFPAEFTVLATGPAAVLKSAPHPSAARLLATFYMSREFSQTLASAYDFPLRSDVPARDGRNLSQIKYYASTPSRLEVAIPEVVAKWRETFGDV